MKTPNTLKPAALAQAASDILLSHSHAPAAAPPATKESLLARIARERREARAAGAAPPPVMPRTKLKRRKVREVIVEVEKKPLMLHLCDLAFHPHLKRVGLLPALIERETKKGNTDGKRRHDHKANAEELSTEFEALKLSILEHGLREPLKVVKDAKGNWQVVDGRHRFLAVQHILAENCSLGCVFAHNPTHLANAEKLETHGVTCVEIPPDQVDAVIMDAVKRRHFSKGAIAYLAVLMQPKIATEAKRGGDQKSNLRKKGLIEDYTAGARIEDFAKRSGVSQTTMESAIRLYKIFAEREDVRLACEPGIWIGDSLDKVIAGALSYQAGKTDDTETDEQRDKRLAVERAGKAVDRLDQLNIALRTWEDLLPEGQLMVIERAVLVLSEAPVELRQAIHKGLALLPGAV
jgi:hypothetical protein